MPSRSRGRHTILGVLLDYDHADDIVQAIEEEATEAADDDDKRAALRYTRGPSRNAADERRAEKANAIRQLVHGVEQAPSWPPPHGWQPPVNEA